MEAVFLNPVEPKAMKHHIRSARLKGWLATVKKHGGDMKAAVKEWRARRAPGAKPRHSASAAVARGAHRALSGLTARRAAANPKGGIQMAARRRKTSRRRNRYEAPPSPAWVGRWKEGMFKKLGRVPKGPVFKRTKTEKSYRRKYRVGLARGLSRSVRRARGSAKVARRSFRSKVLRGVRAVPMLMTNPFSTERWMRRSYAATGFRPRVRRSMPGSSKWWSSVGRGVRRKGSGAYARGVAGSAAKWQKGILSAVRREVRGALAKRAANPIRRRRKSKMAKRRLARISRKRSRRSARRSSRHSYPLALLGAGALVRPTRRKRSRRMRNPIQDNVKALIAKDAVGKYAYVVGGATAGGLLPGLLIGGLKKLGLFGTGTTAGIEAGVGVLASAIAGVVVGAVTKSDEKGVLVAAGGLGGVLGALLVGWLKPTLGLSGLGADAENALQSAVSREMAKMGISGSVGQFLLPGEAEGGTSGLGQFLTQPDMERDVASTSGLGIAEDLSSDGSNAFGDFDGSVF